jgi:hypothetical protein
MIKLVGSEERGHAASWSRARYRTVLDLAWISTEFGALRRTPMPRLALGVPSSLSRATKCAECQAGDAAGAAGAGRQARPRTNLNSRHMRPAHRDPVPRLLLKQQRRELSQIPPPDHPCVHSRRFNVGMGYTFRL